MGPKRVCLVVLSLLLLAGCRRQKEASPVAPAAPVLAEGDDGDTIVKKAAEANGGEEAFQRWRCGVVRYRTMVVPPGETRVVANALIEDTFDLPDYLKRVVWGTGNPSHPSTMAFVVDHGKVQMMDAAGRVAAAPDVPPKAVHEFAGLCSPQGLRQGGLKLTALGKSMVGTRDTLGVRVEADGSPARDFFFEVRTGMLAKSKSPAPKSFGGDDSFIESFLEDYQEIDGVKMPMHIKILQGWKTVFDVKIQQVRFEKSIDKGVFVLQ
jgi:hypothetical protein